MKIKICNCVRLMNIFIYTWYTVHIKSIIQKNCLYQRLKDKQAERKKSNENKNIEYKDK